MLRPSHSFPPAAAMFCLCCANNFLHNQIALDLGTQRERATEGGEGEHTVSLNLHFQPHESRHTDVI